MAHSAFHFSLGMAFGTSMLLRPVFQRLIAGRKLAVCFGKWLIASYGLGVLAIAPGLLGSIGVPETVCRGWWMNIFLFHPLIDKVKTGGMLIGELGIISCFLLQYLLLLAALRKRLRRENAV